jgi:hypothetical protein
MSDEYGTLSAGHARIAGVVETMMTAGSLQQEDCVSRKEGGN